MGYRPALDVMSWDRDVHYGRRSAGSGERRLFFDEDCSPRLECAIGSSYDGQRAPSNTDIQGVPALLSTCLSLLPASRSTARDQRLQTVPVLGGRSMPCRT